MAASRAGGRAEPLHAITFCGESTGKGTTEERRSRKRKLRQPVRYQIRKLSFPRPTSGRWHTDHPGEKAGCYAKGKFRIIAGRRVNKGLGMLHMSSAKLRASKSSSFQNTFMKRSSEPESATPSCRSDYSQSPEQLKLIFGPVVSAHAFQYGSRSMRKRRRSSLIHSFF